MTGEQFEGSLVIKEMEQSGDRVSVVFGFEGQKGRAELQLHCQDKEVLLKGPFQYPDRSGDWVFTKLKNAKTALSGQKLFEANCAICHFHDSKDTKVGPGLSGLFKKLRLSGSGLPISEENIQKRIVNGGDKMPPFKHLKDDEVRAIIDYLKGLLSGKLDLYPVQTGWKSFDNVYQSPRMPSMPQYCVSSNGGPGFHSF